jgi:serine protease Do
MNKTNKTILITISFFIILLSGFVFGHFVFKPPQQEGNPEASARKEQVTIQLNDRRNAITETASRVSSAVVGINVTEIREFKDPFYEFYQNDPFFRQFFGDRSYKQEVHGLGSGFIISDDGYIITNEHVIGNANKVVISMTNGEHHDAEIIGKDAASDIAVLKINKRGLPYLTFGNSDEVIIGEWVIALGNPFGLFEVGQKPTVTVGVVSATNMKLSAGQNRFYRGMIQTDAAINSGNSGGPLVNSEGEVIGMNAIIFTGGSFSQGNIGLGFAIPINKVRTIVDELKKSGKIERNFNLGLRIQPVDQNIAQYYKLNAVRGVIVIAVQKGSPADDEGIKPEDVILTVNGENVNSEADFWGIVVEKRVGDKLKLTILRSGSEIEKEIEIKSQ